MTEAMVRSRMRREFSALGLALLVYSLVLNQAVAVFSIPTALEAMLHGGMDDPALLQSMLVQNAWGYLAACLSGLVLLFAWKGIRFWKTEIWAPGKQMKASAFFRLVCVFLGVQILASILTQVMNGLLNVFGLDMMDAYESMGLDDTDSLSMFLYGSIAAPIFEELLFRGLLLKSMKPCGKRFAIFGSALCFGMFHGNLVQAPFAFAVGLVLGYVASTYSIGWSMVLHMINNMVIADWFNRLYQWMPTAAMDWAQTGLLLCCTVLGCIILVRCRKQIALFFHRNPMDRRAMLCFFTNFGMILFFLMCAANMAAMITATVS